MKRFVMILAMLWALLPMGQVWANSGGGSTPTYYAALKAQVSSNSEGMGKVYAGKSSETTPGTYDTESTSNSSGTGQNFTFKAFASPGDGNQFKGWSDSDGGTIVSTDNPYVVTVTSNSTTDGDPTQKQVYAHFSEIPTFNGTVYEVNDYNTFKTKVSEVEQGDIIAICADIAVLQDESIKIPEGVKVTVASGKMLKVYGNLTIPDSAQLTGEGIVVSYTKVVTQAATVNVPFPLGTDGKAGTEAGVNGTDGTAGKYLKTTVSDGRNLTGVCQCAQQYMIKVVNEASGKVFFSAPFTGTPVGILCTTAREQALNWIESVGDVYTDPAELLLKTATVPGSETHALKDNNNLAVFLSDASVTFSSTANSSSDLGFIVDLAGREITLTSKSASKQWNSTRLVRFFNGKVNVSQKVMNTNFCVYNCTGSFGYLSGSTYYTAISFYDSPGVRVTWNDMSSETPAGGQNYYGGGKYTSTNARLQTTPKTNFNVVYSGTYGFDPTNYLYDPNKVEVKQISTSEWEVIPKIVDPNIGEVKVNGEETTLALAITNAKNGDVIVLQRDVELLDSLVCNAENVRLDLSGWKLSGKNKDITITNNGDLEFIDTNGNGEISVAIANSGTLLFSSAEYCGKISLNAGQCHFLSGTYSGGIEISQDAEDDSEIAVVYGGTFSPLTYVKGDATKDLVSLCPHGYVSGNAIAQIPETYVENPSFAQYKLYAFNAVDKALYTREAARSGYTREEWIRVNQLRASSEMFRGWVIDCAVKFDRDVNVDDVTVTLAIASVKIPVAIPAGKDYSALLQAMRLSGQATAGYTYASFLPGGEHENGFSFKVSAIEAQNGTTCDLSMRLVSGYKNMSGPKDWSYDTYVTTARRRFVFGANGYKAMTRPETGSATFYSTLQEAVANSATDDQTIFLTQDQELGSELVVNKACIIDPNGFEFTGARYVKPGTDYEVVPNENEEVKTITIRHKPVVTIPVVEGAALSVSINGENVEVVVDTETGEATVVVPTGAKVVVAYTADEDNGYEFVAEVQTVYTLESVTEDARVLPNTDLVATLKRYTICITSVAHTTVSVDESPCAETSVSVRWGEGVTIVYTVEEGYELSGGNGTYTLENVKANATVGEDLTTTRKQFEITITSVAHTTVSVNGTLCTETLVTVPWGEDVRIVYTAEEGYELSRGNGTYTLENVKANATVGEELTTTRKQFEITIASVAHTTVSVNGTPCTETLVTVPWGEDVRIVYTAEEGYELSGGDGMYVLEAVKEHKIVGSELTVRKLGPSVSASFQSSQDELQLVPTTRGVDVGTMVSYALAKLVSQDGKEVYEIVSDSSLTIDLSGEGDPTGLYKIKMFVGDDEEGLLSDNTIGVMKCQPVGEVKWVQTGEGEAKTEVEYLTSLIPVPWTGENGTPMTLDKLLRVSDLSAGDSVRSYDPTSGSGLYAMWELVEENGKLSWSPYTTAERATGTLQDAGAAGETQLPRGTGLWLTRKKKGKVFPPIYLCGEYDETQQEPMTLKAGWNLVANPNLTEFVFDGLTADTIVVPGMPPKTFTKANGVWGYTKSEKVDREIGGKTVTGVRNTRVTDESKVGPGQGFWFVSSGEQTLNWNGGAK